MCAILLVTSAHTTMPGKRGRGRPRKSQTIRTSTLRERIASIKWTESYTSLLMGVVVVIVAVLFVVSFLKQTHHVQQTSSTSTVAITQSADSISLTQAPTTTPSELNQSEKTYTVKAGDDLWHIAETYYKSGYNWVDIAKANNLADPSTIHAGNKLVIPRVTPVVATISSTPTIQAAPKIITNTTYTVQKGDTLWNIAVRAYADGYQWTKIAQVNNLTNPSLIFSGNVLTIPR